MMSVAFFFFFLTSSALADTLESTRVVKEVVIKNVVRPLEEVSIEIKVDISLKQLEFKIQDAAGSVYDRQKVAVHGGVAKTTTFVGGAIGVHTLSIFLNQEKIGVANFMLDPETLIQTKGGRIDSFLEGLKSQVEKDRTIHMVNNEPVNLYAVWLRDHIYEMKGYKYWENDVASGFGFFLKRQHPRGFFYEIKVPPEDPHVACVSPEWISPDKKNNFILVRLEIEADIEYLMVEALYTIWQATGNSVLLEPYLLKVEKGLLYLMSDPDRWSSRHGLVKRAFTIDTWDFTYAADTWDRNITEDTPMAIMHGDNSGVYYACRKLSELYRLCGNIRKSRYWRRKAEQFKRNTNRVCWNGKFYTHQIHLGKIPDTGLKEEVILSFSNVYDINRGLADHQKAVSIIKEYIKRYREQRSEYFAEWFSISPSYAEFPGNSFPGYTAGSYINGGIASFVAGELAKASFNHGFETYGLDIINRLCSLWQKDGRIYFLYTREGNDQGGGPEAWGASAIISALIEGLAGLYDKSCLFKNVEISPRWAVSNDRYAWVIASYGASKAYCSYIYTISPQGNSITLKCTKSTRGEYSFHILLPSGKLANAVMCNSRKIPFRIIDMEGSKYADFKLNSEAVIQEIVIYLKDEF